MRKSFDELTIADDFMFCKVMQDEQVCKTFLEMTLADKIGKISHLSSQSALITGAETKSIRLDILVQDETGKSYDIEMSFSDRRPVYRKTRVFPAKNSHTYNLPCVLPVLNEAAWMPLKLIDAMFRR